MRILLVDGEVGETAVLAGQLGERGHEVVRCFPEAGSSICVGVRHPELCPVESLGCDVALVVRDPTEAPSIREMSAICAVRRHIPLVEACQDASSPFARWATSSGTAVVEAVEDFDTGARPTLVAAVEKKLSFLPAVIRLGRVPTIAVRQKGSSVHLTINIPPGTSSVDEESMVTWAVRALREADPYTASADVSVRRI